MHRAVSAPIGADYTRQRGPATSGLQLALATLRSRSNSAEPRAGHHGSPTASADWASPAAAFAVNIAAHVGR